MDGVRKSKQQVFVVPRTEHDATLRRFGNRRRQRLPFEIGEVFAAQSIVQMFRVRQARRARKAELEARRMRHGLLLAAGGGGVDAHGANKPDGAGGGGGGGGTNEDDEDTGSGSAEAELLETGAGTADTSTGGGGR
jgi:hypothetical protein